MKYYSENSRSDENCEFKHNPSIIIIIIFVTSLCMITNCIFPVHGLDIIARNINNVDTRSAPKE